MKFGLRTMILAAVAACGLGVFGACAASSKASSSRNLMEGEEKKPPRKPDTLYLHDGEEVQGHLVGQDRGIYRVVLSNGNERQIPAGAIKYVDLSPDSRAERNALAMRPAPPPRKAARSSWYPRAYNNDKVKQVEITWWDDHPFTGEGSCAGQLAESFTRFPEMQLYLPEGGWLILRDRRRFGYHAHTFPSNSFHKPVERGVLRIPVPKDEAALPQAVAFVSPSQETEAQDGSDRKGVAISDVIYAETRKLSEAEASLMRQPFGGGGPQTTGFGKLWAFSLTRNHATWYVYLADPTGTHSRFLKKAFAAYGDTILEASVAIDTLDASGQVVGRVLAVPFPDGSVTAESVATIYSGERDNATALVNVRVPPRERIVTPGQPSDTKADIRIHHYGVSDEMPQSIVLAYGTGRPSGDDVKKIERELTPDKADEHIVADFTSLDDSAFPAICWVYQRRTLAWNSGGGRLIVGPDLRVPPAEPQKLTKYKWAPPINHVTPILLLGANPPSPQGYHGPDPGAQLAGGMANGLAHDALMREAGGSLGNLTGNINPNISGGQGGYYSNTSNVYVLVPPAGGGGGMMTGGGGIVPPPAGMYLRTDNPNQLRSMTGRGAMSVAGAVDSAGNYYNTQGQEIFNSRDAVQQYYGGGGGQLNASGMSVDNAGNASIMFNRRNGP